MKKINIFYVCSSCGEEYSKWQGKCTVCGGWNSLKEYKENSFAKKNLKNKEKAEIINLANVKTEKSSRVKINIEEVDRVLGGGLVSGSVVLLSGEPGIGKSTLVMQVASKLNTIYITGEESIQQIKMRADRLKVNLAKISLLSETDVDTIINALKNEKPDLIIVDSIQTMYLNDYPSTAGSLVQVRESALRLGNFAKEKNIPIILIGHVTKEGTIAGPKTLEHMVDVVLNLEGEKFYDLRILRAIKNRFGQTSEIGIFKIENDGLIEVSNPSEIFLGDSKLASNGTVVTVAMEGTRPLLVEIQALTSPSSFGYPKRTAVGFDLNRLQLIIAILINRGGINLSSSDVYLNVSGGFTLKEPAADLAVALAIVSAYKNKKIAPKTIAFGELTLSGEVRRVLNEEKRIFEAKRLGYSKIIKTNNLFQIVKEIVNA